MSLVFLLFILPRFPFTQLSFVITAGIDTKIVSCKNGKKARVATITVFDDTAETTVSLWNIQTTSSSHWEAFSTVLLLSNAGWKKNTPGMAVNTCRQQQQQRWGNRNRTGTGNPESLNGSLVLRPNITLVDVNPDFPDAHWLRKFGEARKWDEGVCLQVPDNGMYPVLLS